MIAKRAYVAALAGVIGLAGGFFVGRTVGDAPPEPEVGSIPSTLKNDRSPAQTPILSPAGALPSLQVTPPSEEAVASESGSTFEATKEPASPPSEVTVAPNG